MREGYKQRNISHLYLIHNVWGVVLSFKELNKDEKTEKGSDEKGTIENNGVTSTGSLNR